MYGLPVFGRLFLGVDVTGLAGCQMCLHDLVEVIVAYRRRLLVGLDQDRERVLPAVLDAADRVVGDDVPFMSSGWRY